MPAPPVAPERWTLDKLYTVRAAHCDHRADDEAVYRALCRVTDPLERAWERLEAAARIALKVNLVWPPEKLRFHAGRRCELVDDSVLRAVLRRLKERCRGQITVADTSLERDQHDLYFFDQLAEYGVDFVNCSEPPAEVFEPAGGGLMFGRYLLHPIIRQADAMVSLATLKSHNFMGVTLTTKNLFGLCPMHPANRPRTYFHHIVRLPYVLADLARITRPALNIVDGLVAQTGVEWGGDPLVTNALLAGDHGIATDFCGCLLMGNDPTADFPTPPFRRDRNHLRVAAAAGWGPARLDEIDWRHDLDLPLGQFDSNDKDSPERVAAWQASMVEQALAWEADPQPTLQAHPGSYAMIQDNQVLWHGEFWHGFRSRRDLAGVKPDRAIWLKYLDPEDFEQERFEVYRRHLAEAGVPVL